MSHEQTMEDESVDQWLRERFPLGPLEDLSLSGRQRFLEKHGDVLWDFWSNAFSIAIASGQIDPKRALGAQANESEHASKELADRLIGALGTRLVMDFAPAWENLERWYAWLVGAAAVRARTPTLANTGPRDERGNDAQEELMDLRRLLERWARLLKSLVERTGIPAIELDWLWATRRVRRRLPEAMGEEGDETTQLLDTHLRNSIASSSAPGASPGARTARTRDGAAACLRFNIEEMATRSAQSSPSLTKAREVFVGPADSKPPYRPRAPIDGVAVAGFRESLRLSAERARSSPEDSVAERLWKDVFRCALKDAVLRLLPRKQGDALQAEISLWKDAAASDEKDGP